MNYLLGIDVGTSSLKTILLREDGSVAASVAPEYPFETPRPLWAETDPALWWQAAREAIPAVLTRAGVSGSQVVGIGLTGQMHGLVLLDGAGEPLRPCIMWNDQRTARQCAAITAEVGAERVLEITGNPVLPGFTAPKIRWVRDNEPEVFARAAHVLLPKDYLRYKLAGTFATDVADGSGMALMNVRARAWSEEMLAAAGVRREWLPGLSESVEATARVSAEAAALLGLREGTPIAAGAGDQAAQAAGCGIVEEGIVSATFGTSGVVFAHSREYRVEPQGRLHAFCSAVPGEWHLMGVMLSAAGSLQWYRNALGGAERSLEAAGAGDAYDLLLDPAERVPAGAEGLFFLPYLSGERTPHPDPLARGCFVGLTLRHKKSHVTRAVLEGITFGMRDSLELMRSLGIRPKTVIASGGGARSPFWRQMMADVFGAQVALVNVTEGAAFGAALIGGVAAGLYPDIHDACRRAVRRQEQVTPDAGTQAVYEKAYRRYGELYPALQGFFTGYGE